MLQPKQKPRVNSLSKLPSHLDYKFTAIHLRRVNPEIYLAIKSWISIEERCDLEWWWCSYLRYSSFYGCFKTLNHSLSLCLWFDRGSIYMSDAVFLPIQPEILSSYITLNKKKGYLLPQNSSEIKWIDKHTRVSLTWWASGPAASTLPWKTTYCMSVKVQIASKISLGLSLHRIVTTE